MDSAHEAVGDPGVRVVEPHPEIERPAETVGPYGFRLVGTAIGGDYRTGVRRQPGVAELHYLTRRLPERRRQFLARLVRMRAIHGWRVNVGRWLAAWDMFDRNTDALQSVQTFRHAGRSEALLVFQGTQVGMDDVTAMTDAVNDAHAGVTAPEAAQALSEQSALQVLLALHVASPLTSASHLPVSGHGPPGDDPPPQVADVLTLLSAPRPGPLYGVPVAA